MRNVVPDNVLGSVASHCLGYRGRRGGVASTASSSAPAAPVIEPPFPPPVVVLQSGSASVFQQTVLQILIFLNK